MDKILIVFLGGGIGACLRYLTSQWAADRWGADFPYGTFLVNVVGCFIIGLFMALATEKYILNPYWRLLIIVGFVGGLTTFSSFSYESIKLWQESGLDMAFINIFCNLLFGLSATWLGIIIIKWL